MRWRIARISEVITYRTRELGDISRGPEASLSMATVIVRYAIRFVMELGACAVYHANHGSFDWTKYHIFDRVSLIPKECRCESCVPACSALRHCACLERGQLHVFARPVRIPILGSKALA